MQWFFTNTDGRQTKIKCWYDEKFHKLNEKSKGYIKPVEGCGLEVHAEVLCQQEDALLGAHRQFGSTPT